MSGQRFRRRGVLTCRGRNRRARTVTGEGQMQDGNRTGRRHRRTAVSVIGLTVAAVVLAACSSTPGVTGTANIGGGGAAAPAANVKPVSIDIQPAAAAVMNPADPVVVKATNGT